MDSLFIKVSILVGCLMILEIEVSEVNKNEKI